MTLRGYTAAVSAILLPGLVCAFAAAPVPQTPVSKASPEELEFFEKKVRPVLAEHCVPCHSGAQASGNLRLDRFDGLFGANGKLALVTPGSPDQSTLIQAVRYTVPALRMPPSGKLSLEQLATLEDWVRRGAAVPVTKATGAPVSAAGFPLAKRRQHWAYQPIKPQTVPKVKNSAWVRTPVDAFVLSKLEAAGLKPAPPADKRTLLRRVTFDLTGLPPTPQEMQAFLRDARPGAYERQVERLLASPAYGERWARHWLDLVRYGETLGHEYDWDIPNAYQYRDYVIRALNADVSYDQFVREHIAGDLIAHPRRDAKTGRNESIIGTGFWWLAEGKHSPVDVKQEQADRIDNQIDVFGKAFLGQTIACARCHDHKFDPIPTRDYYALYGILKSSRYQQAHVDAPATFSAVMQQIDAMQTALPRAALAKVWQDNLAALPEDKLQAVAQNGNVGVVAQSGTLAPLTRWLSSGEAFAQFGKPGDLILSGSADKPAVSLLPTATADSALRSPRLEGALRSPTFTIDKDFLHLRLSGHQSRVHVIVENFQVIREPIYGPLSFVVENARPGWRVIDMRMWKGRRAYLELSDSPLSNLSLDPIAPPDRSSDGWLRLDAALLSDNAAPSQVQNALRTLPAPQLRTHLQQTLSRWASRTLTPGDADALAVTDELLAQGLLDTHGLVQAAGERRRIEAPLPAPTRVVAMCDGDGENESVFVRGNYRTPGATAPRLQLALFRQENASLPQEKGSGRRELATWLTRPQHPLLARVLVNRLWKQHFGTGIVATPDDFGHMGEKPTHPELLDWLALDFVQHGWSLKAMHRRMVLSSTYRMSSIATNPTLAAQKDPKNALLHQMPVHRLEAEAIRDALLVVSGRLDRTLYGASVPQHLSDFEDGRGRPASGPLDGNGRRSLYLGIRRNFLSPWMLAFDFPTPFTTIGRRTVSNVPSQALALMNGPFVRQQAEVWANRVVNEMPHATTAARVTVMYETAFGRPPLPSELQAAEAFIGTPTGADEKAAWADYCHVLFNTKEFIFVR